MVVACLALAIALGGTSYATILQVPRNSVGTLQLKRNAVTSSKIAPNAVRTAHVVDGSLLAADFKPGQLPQGPKGDRGVKGDKGDRGPAGPAGISGYEIVRSSAIAPANTTLGSVQARCPVGKRVLGGAASVQGVPSGVWLHTGHTAFSTGDSYDVIAVNTTAFPQQINSLAFCGTVEP